MLDDLKYIHQQDAQDALGVAAKQYQQLLQQFVLGDNQASFERIKNVVFAGMGGSALYALISTSWPGFNIPFEIVRGYDIPSYTSPNTLFIASSYSGNTEETVEALGKAKDKAAQIAVIASGGKLADIAAEQNYPLAKLPGGLQPRHATLYGLKAFMVIMAKFGLLVEGDVEPQLQEAARFLQETVEAWRPDVPTAHNYAKQIAQELAGRSIVIYGGPKMFPAAYKWKISFNENAKNVAWCNAFPEFNHNEMLGWSSHPVDKPYAVINLRSRFEHERVQKRFEVTDRLLSGKRPAAINIEAQGDSLLNQLLWQVALGEFVSIYLALINGINPTPVDLIEKFKTELT